MTHNHGKILVCNPTYYGIDYEINPWMSVQNRSFKVRKSSLEGLGMQEASPCRYTHDTGKR
jgi:hypothetical protein